MLFPTGFATNLGVLTTFGGPGTFVCSDELNHASIIDGTPLARGEVAVYPHRDLDVLDTLLRERTEGRRALVVSDTVFSMDGDVADVDGLAELCAHHDALLVLDEAHAVLGPELADPGPTVLRIGTLSKTLGALGGFVAGPRALTELVVNRARTYIFTTATSPADAAAALAALRVVRGSEGEVLRARLRANVDELRPGHPSPIVPALCGHEARAVAAAQALLELGLLVPAIRPPTVPAGTSRLRIALSAAHSVDQVAMLRRARSKASTSRDQRPADRHRDRGRQDLVGAGHGRRPACEWCHRSRRASPCSPTRPRSSARPMQRSSGGRAASRPRRCARVTVGTRCRWHRRWRPTCSVWPRSRSRSWSRRSRPHRRERSRWSRVRAGPAHPRLRRRHREPRARARGRRGRPRRPGRARDDQRGTAGDGRTARAAERADRARRVRTASTAKTTSTAATTDGWPARGSVWSPRRPSSPGLLAPG